MTTAVAILRVIHILNAVLMAWPFYALVIVNQRVRLGPPLGDRADTYMENTIKNRTIPLECARHWPVLRTGCAIYAKYRQERELRHSKMLQCVFGNACQEQATLKVPAGFRFVLAIRAKESTLRGKIFF